MRLLCGWRSLHLERNNKIECSKIKIGSIQCHLAQTSDELTVMCYRMKVSLCGALSKAVPFIADPCDVKPEGSRNALVSSPVMSAFVDPGELERLEGRAGNFPFPLTAFKGSWKRLQCLHEGKISFQPPEEESE